VRTSVNTTRDIIPLLLPYHHTLPSFTKSERIGWHGDQNFAGKHAMFVFSPLSSSKTGIRLWYGALSIPKMVSCSTHVSASTGAKHPSGEIMTTLCYCPKHLY
jgi:hypothetical protein